jgi:hypothetical protein
MRLQFGAILGFSRFLARGLVGEADDRPGIGGLGKELGDCEFFPLGICFALGSPQVPMRSVWGVGPFLGLFLAHS